MAPSQETSQNPAPAGGPQEAGPDLSSASSPTPPGSESRSEVRELLLRGAVSPVSSTDIVSTAPPIVAPGVYRLTETVVQTTQFPGGVAQRQENVSTIGVREVPGAPATGDRASTSFFQTSPAAQRTDTAAPSSSANSQPTTPFTQPIQNKTEAPVVKAESTHAPQAALDRAIESMRQGAAERVVVVDKPATLSPQQPQVVTERAPSHEAARAEPPSSEQQRKQQAAPETNRPDEKSREDAKRDARPASDLLKDLEKVALSTSQGREATLATTPLATTSQPTLKDLPQGVGHEPLPNTPNSSAQPSIVDKPQDPSQQTQKISHVDVDAAIAQALQTSRTESAKNLREILAIEMATTPQHAPGTDTNATTQSPLSPQTAPTQRANDSITERINLLQETLLATIVPRTVERPSTDTAPAEAVAKKNQGDFTRIDTVKQRQEQSTSVAARGETRPADTPNGGQARERSRLDQLSVSRDDSAKVDRTSRLLKAMGLHGKTKLSLDGLRKLESAFETGILSLAAAAAIGVLATDRVAREILRLGKALRASLEENQDVDRVDLDEAIEALEDALHNPASKPTENEPGIVADISGVVTDAGTGLPIEGVLIDGGLLGSTYTNSTGIFLFKNIPLKAPFELRPHDKRYHFDPGSIVGTVGEMNHFTLVGSTASKKG